MQSIIGLSGGNSHTLSGTALLSRISDNTVGSASGRHSPALSNGSMESLGLGLGIGGGRGVAYGLDPRRQDDVLSLGTGMETEDGEESVELQKAILQRYPSLSSVSIANS